MQSWAMAPLARIKVAADSRKHAITIALVFPPAIVYYKYHLFFINFVSLCQELTLHWGELALGQVSRLDESLAGLHHRLYPGVRLLGLGLGSAHNLPLGVFLKGRITLMKSNSAGLGHLI